VLQDGPMAAKEVFRQAKELRLSERTIKRAKRLLKVEARRVGGIGAKGHWEWFLPSETSERR
jgi:hypothetical protein